MSVSVASRASASPVAVSLSPVALYGARAVDIRDQVLAASRISLADLLGRTQGRKVVWARQAIAYRVWTEVPSATLSQIAKLIGRSDHSAAIHAILAHARHRGIDAAKVSDLRDGSGDAVDWTKLAYATAGWREANGLTLDRAARASGIARGEWRKAEQGRSLSAGTLLSICRAVDLDPLSLIAPHETAVKHEVEP